MVDIEFGYVQAYNVQRGFGYVSCTFSKSKQKHKDFKRRYRDDVYWFHIKKVKRDYPDVARLLDTGSFANLSFWYEVENRDNDRVSVSEIWLDSKDIPKQKKDDLVAYIEEQWCVSKNTLPKWLDSVTLSLTGDIRRNELKQLHDKQCEEAEEQERLQRQAQIAQRSSQIPTIRDRFRSERGIIETIFANNKMHGLPPELQEIVIQCPRHSRTNPLSHKPGGSDVVVAYSLGHAILYDFIKNVELYIRSFERQDPGFHLHITSIYGRFYKDPNEREIGVFCPIWTLNRNGALQSAVKACVSRYQRQMEIGYTTLHHEAKEYWKNQYGLSEQEVEKLPTLYKQYYEGKKR